MKTVLAKIVVVLHVSLNCETVATTRVGHPELYLLLDGDFILLDPPAQSAIVSFAMFVGGTAETFVRFYIVFCRWQARSILRQIRIV
eukprot:scaffold2047_cov129-Cylindrotheca_fusiformis.AAC.10